MLKREMYLSRIRGFYDSDLIKILVGIRRCGEIDFIATKTDEKLYFQVTYLLESDKVQDRKFGAFKEIEDNYPKYVLSLDKANFLRDGIIHKNIIDWLLEK